jgi:ribosome-binding protein aMBF1 (putative translation factor)
MSCPLCSKSIIGKDDSITIDSLKLVLCSICAASIYFEVELSRSGATLRQKHSLRRAFNQLRLSKYS